MTILSYSEMIDVDLWNLLIKGDTKALEPLYRRHYDLLLNYGLKLYADQELIKDCIQDLFVKLHKSSKLKSTQYVRSYLLKSLKNILYDKLSTKKELEVLNEQAFNLVTDDALLVQLFQKNDEDLHLSYQLTEAYNQLSASQKSAVYLRFVKELSYKEIGEIMDINTQSSMNLVARSLTKLRTLLTQVKLILFFC